MFGWSCVAQSTFMDIYGIEVMWHRCSNLWILWTMVLTDHFDSKIKMVQVVTKFCCFSKFSVCGGLSTTAINSKFNFC